MMMMIQITVFSSASASAFWILCLLCSIGHAVPTESPSSDLFDTSQSGFSSLDQTSLDFWNGGDLQFQSNNDDFADGFPGTSASAIEPGSSDLFDDTTTTTFSAVGNDPYLASYMNGDATNFQEGGITQIAMDASSSSSSSSCELGGARDSESSVDVDLDVDKISRRDHRDFGDIIDFGRHGCPLGKEAACCSSGRPERVQNSMRMRPECRTWGIWETVINMGCPNRYRYCCSDVDPDSTGIDCDLIFPEDQLDQQRPGPSCGNPQS